MIRNGGRSISDLLADTAVINAAVTRGVREALQQHAQAGRSVPVAVDGKVVWRPASLLLQEWQDANDSATQ